jgi:hypothetical protein
MGRQRLTAQDSGTVMGGQQAVLIDRDAAQP